MTGISPREASVGSAPIHRLVPDWKPGKVIALSLAMKSEFPQRLGGNPVEDIDVVFS